MVISQKKQPVENSIIFSSAHNITFFGTIVIALLEQVNTAIYDYDFFYYVF